MAEIFFADVADGMKFGNDQTGVQRADTGRDTGFRAVFANAVERTNSDEQVQNTNQTAKPAAADNARAPDAKTERSEPTSGADKTQKPDDAADDIKTLPSERKVQAAISELREKISDGEPLDEETAAMLLNLLALLLSGENDEEETLQILKTLFGAQQSGEMPEINLAIAIDKDSELYALLSKLVEMAKANPETDDGLKLLIRLSETEALAIPLEEISLSDAAETGENTNKIFLTVDDASEESAAVFRLKISLESVKYAQVVTLPETTPSDGAIFLALPEAVAQETESPIIQLPTDNKLLSEDAKAAETQDKARVVVLPIAQQADAETGNGNIRALDPEVRDFVRALLNRAGEIKAEPAVAVRTANPMYMSSDDHLTALELMAFLKGVDGKTKSPLMARIAQLLNGGTEAADETFVQTLLGAENPGSRLTKLLFDDLEGRQTQRWQNEILKARTDRLETASTAARNLSNLSEQIQFLPRTPAESFALSEAVSRAAAPMPHTSPQLASDVMNQLIQRISFNFVNGNAGEIRVFLRPESLGDVHLKVKVDHEVMVAKFVAQSQEVKAIIENNLSSLRDALLQQGIKVAKMEVSLSNGSPHQGANPWNQQGGETAPEYLPYADTTTAAYDNYLLTPEVDFYYGTTSRYAAATGSVNYFA
ncbi:MAG: flagellar hook-length control protein FliK [bacterium]